MYKLGIAYLLWLVSGFGALGFHRFYLGKIPSGLLWMFSGGLCGVGAIYDFFTLPRQVLEANLRESLARGYVPPGAAEWAGSVPGGSQAWRTVNDLKVKDVDEPLERRILRAARQRGGVLSASDAALDAHVSLAEAQKELEKMVSRGHAELRIRKSGALAYTFPDFMNPGEEFEV